MLKKGYTKKQIYRQKITKGRKGENMYEEFENVWVTEPRRHVGDGRNLDRITLAELYKRGWWITEIFGSYATVVSKSQSPSLKRYYYFCCMQCQIDTTALTPQVMRKIKAINSAQWNKYKNILLNQHKWRSRIKKKESTNGRAKN